MKALTVQQPYATLMACGAKRIETLRWPTEFRGEVAICAAETFSDQERETLHDCYLKAALLVALQEGYWHEPELPLGCVVAVGTLVDCVQMGPAFYRWYADLLTPWERALGSYAPNRYAWVFQNVSALRDPVPISDQRALWEWRPASYGDPRPITVAPAKTQAKRQAVLRMLGTGTGPLHDDDCPRSLESSPRAKCTCMVQEMSDFLGARRANRRRALAETIAEHGSTASGHRQQLNVRVHSYLQAGDIIGLEGSTRWSTGSTDPHPHVVVELDHVPVSVPVNPMPYVGYAQAKSTNR